MQSDDHARLRSLEAAVRLAQAATVEAAREILGLGCHPRAAEIAAWYWRRGAGELGRGLAVVGPDVRRASAEEDALALGGDFARHVAAELGARKVEVL